MGSRLVRLVLALAISIVFVWLAFRDLDTQAVWASLTELGAAPVLVYVGSIFGIHLLRTYRWHLMVRALDPNQPFWQSLRISFFCGCILVPLRLGEFARPLLLRRARSIPVSAGSVRSPSSERSTVCLWSWSWSCRFCFQALPILCSGRWVGWLALFGGAGIAFATMALTPKAPNVLGGSDEALGPAWADRVMVYSRLCGWLILAANLASTFRLFGVYARLLEP